MKIPGYSDSQLQFSAPDSGHILGVNATTIGAWVAEGVLTGKWIRGRLYVPRREIERLLTPAPSTTPPAPEVER